MISFNQIRLFFVSLVLGIMVAITIAFDFGNTNSWAASSPVSSINPPNGQLIAMWGFGESTAKDIEGKAQETIGNLTGDRETQAAGKDKQFKAKTLEGVDNAIVNPNYQPTGKTKKVEKEDSEAIKASIDQAHADFKSIGKDEIQDN